MSMSMSVSVSVSVSICLCLCVYVCVYLFNFFFNPPLIIKFIIMFRSSHLELNLVVKDLRNPTCDIYKQLNKFLYSYSDLLMGYVVAYENLGVIKRGVIMENGGVLIPVSIDLISISVKEGDVINMEDMKYFGCIECWGEGEEEWDEGRVVKIGNDKIKVEEI